MHTAPRLLLVPLTLFLLGACSGGAPSTPTGSSTASASTPAAAGSSEAPEAPTAGEPAASASEPAASASEPAAPAGDAVHLREVLVRDPARNEMPAYRLLVPKGWEVEGGVTPVTAYPMIPTISDVTVRGPDGRGARFWSLLEFGYADGVSLRPFTPFDGRPFFPLPNGLGDYWREAVRLSPAEGVTDFRVVSEDVLEDATEHVRKMLAPLYQSTAQEDRQMRMSGQGSKEFHADARRLVVRYKLHGKPIEAVIFGSLRKSIYRYPHGPIRAAMWNIDHAYAVFGPVGTDLFNDPLLAAVVRSRRELPEWQEAIQRWYVMKNQQIVAEGQARIAAAARAAVTTRTTQSQDVLDISFQGWKSRNAANDAGHASSVLGIHERTTYVEPGGTTVDLPSHYQNVYTDGLGNYLLHNDANYQVNTDPTWNSREWQRIEARR